VLEQVRGEHPVYVFIWENSNGQRGRIGHFRNSGWIQARRRAAARYSAELGREAPAGFRDVRVHDLRHEVLTSFPISGRIGLGLKWSMKSSDSGDEDHEDEAV